MKSELQQFFKHVCAVDVDNVPYLIVLISPLADMASELYDMYDIAFPDVLGEFCLQSYESYLGWCKCVGGAQ